MQNFIFKHGQSPWNFLPENDIKEHIEKIRTQEVFAYLAEIDNECVGFTSFCFALPDFCQPYQSDPTQHAAYLSEIVVHRDHVGQGIGSQIINHIKDYLASKNITFLYADRHEENLSSASVMRKTGFSIMGIFMIQSVVHMVARKPQ